MGTDLWVCYVLKFLLCDSYWIDLLKYLTNLVGSGGVLKSEKSSVNGHDKKSGGLQMGVFKGNPTPMKFLVPEFVDHFVQLF